MRNSKLRVGILSLLVTVLLALLIGAPEGPPPSTRRFTATPNLSTSINGSGQLRLILRLVGGEINPICATSLEFATELSFAPEKTKSFLVGSANYSRGLIRLRLTAVPVSRISWTN